MITISGTKHFKTRGLVLLYDNKCFKHPWKPKTHWLGPYVVAHIMNAGRVKLHKLDRTPVTWMVNVSHLKPYYDGRDMPR